MKLSRVLSLLLVLTLTCSCCETEESPASEHTYLLEALLADRQSLRFSYNRQGQVVHSEEADTLFGSTYYSVSRDYDYALLQGLIFCRSIYHREGEWGHEPTELLYLDTLFLSSRQRVDSIHRHLTIEGNTQQSFSLWYQYDEGNQLTALSLKAIPTGGWHGPSTQKWQSQGTLEWQDGGITRFVQPDRRSTKHYSYTEIPNTFYLDARNNLIYDDWIPLLQWFGKRPLYLQESQEEEGIRTLFSYQHQDGLLISETIESIHEGKTETGILHLVWK
ncbi:MAG: hypothetical protein IJ700_00140 [Bacteroidaceae bacterium]|nr:hypothetical protein [Bacteroidaceae bacterium]